MIRNIEDYIHTLAVVQTEKPDFSRTAVAIIQSGYQQGCHEAGTVFVTLLRAKGVQANYIQAFLKADLASYGVNNTFKRGGHVFLRVSAPNGYRIVDSTTGRITQEIPNEYVAGKAGLDSWDIGLKTPEDYVDLFIKTKASAGF